MAEYTESVVVERDDVAQARQDAADHDVRVASEGVEPVTLELSGAAAAVGTVMHLIEQRKGGQVIDLRPDAPTPVYRTADLSFGLVSIHHVDGRLDVAVEEPRGMFGQVLDTLREIRSTIATESLEVAQETVQTVLGEAAEVTVATPSDRPESPQ